MHRSPAWKDFLAKLKQQLPALEVQPLVLDAWRRTLSSPSEAVSPATILRRVESYDLERRLRRNHRLVDVAKPLLQAFSRQASSVPHVVYLVDTDGVILVSVGTSAPMLVQGMLPGYDWSEEAMGTTGASSALATGRLVVAPRPEHYQLEFRPTTSLGAPVHLGQGGEIAAAVEFAVPIEDSTVEHLTQLGELARNIELELGTPTVLNVEDNDAQRYTVTRILRSGGFEVIEATTGREALAHAMLQPSLVLLDIHLPDMDGFEVCRRLRKNPNTAHIPVVHLTSTYVRPSAKADSFDCGSDGYLTHPIDPADLVGAVHGVLRAKTPKAHRPGAVK